MYDGRELLMGNEVYITHWDRVMIIYEYCFIYLVTRLVRVLTAESKGFGFKSFFCQSLRV